MGDKYLKVGSHATVRNLQFVLSGGDWLTALFFFFVLWFVGRHRGDGADLPSPAEPNAQDHRPLRSQSSVTRGSPLLPVLEGHIRVDGSICGSDRQILTPSFIPHVIIGSTFVARRAGM
jgi:hypothetical protein